MRDVSSKANTLRTAKATATLTCLPETVTAIKTGNVPKADPLVVARVAGIQAAKNTSLLIPYCHQVPLDHVHVEIELGSDMLTVHSDVKAIWKTGVEMEALAAASAAALTLYDMLKIIDESMEISSVRLLEKKGGKSDARGLPAKGLSVGILVMSDLGARGEREDASGKAIRDRVEAYGLRVKDHKVIPDEPATIENELRRLCDDTKVDLVLTTGGTGLGPRDNTPKATRNVIEGEVPGIMEILRSHGQERTRYAMLSRGVAGTRGSSLIINLPGSTRGVNESLDVLFPWILHSFEMMRGKGH